LRHAIFKGLAPDKAMVWQHVGAIGHMFAAAEADFKMQWPIISEQAFGCDGAFVGYGYLRQQIVDQILLVRAQLLAL
jgi:hypothetical protein